MATYEIRVEIPPGYPVAEPLVFETGGAFPHDTAHHVYDNDRCCVLVWESWTATAADLSIRAFFDGPLRNYFLGQYAVAHGGAWPFGERAHGAEGLAQACAERLGCAPDLRTVKGFLKGLIKVHGRPDAAGLLAMPMRQRAQYRSVLRWQASGCVGGGVLRGGRSHAGPADPAAAAGRDETQAGTTVRWRDPAR